MRELPGINIILGYLQAIIPNIKGRRKPSPNTKYSIFDKPHQSGYWLFPPNDPEFDTKVERWVSILTRKLLKRGSFSSTADLKQQILAFIDYFNLKLAHPFRWTFKGKLLAV